MIEVGQPASRAKAKLGIGPNAGRAATSPTVKRLMAQAGTSCSAENVGIVGGREADHLVQVRVPPRRHGVAVEQVPAPNEHTSTLLPVRVLLADPPAFTPWYDHEFAAALARHGADVHSRPRGSGSEMFPPPRAIAATSASTRCRRESSSARGFACRSRRWSTRRRRVAGARPRRRRARAVACAPAGRRPPAVPRTIRLHRPRPSAAPHLRQARPVAADARRGSTRSSSTRSGRDTLADLGVAAHVIPHPVYPTAATRADDGQTLLALGVIRPYKGLPDAIEANRRIGDSRLLVVGDPAMPLDGLRTAEHVEWRLGFQPQSELDRALSEATVAVFPYRAELDQSGALLQALGAGVPAVVYDVAGLGEPIRSTARARSCRRATSTR